MSRALYLVGAPATGKSTTLLAVVDRLGGELATERTLWPGHNGVFKGMPIHSIVDGEELGVYLGNLGTKKRVGFPGTDGLSMAAPPVAVEWAWRCPELPELILGEGARLSTDAFMQALALNTELVVGHLLAPQEVLDARCEQRGSNQAATFRRAAATRAGRAAEAAEAAGARVIRVDTTVTGPQETAWKLLDGFACGS